MARVLHLLDKTSITIDDEPVGSGGSGLVYRINSPGHMSNLVVKLYHKERLTIQTHEKIKYLVSKKISQGEHESIVWIKNIVYESGNFVGFTMNYAEGIGLEKLFIDRWWNKKEATEWNKFRLENEKGLENRIKLCLNIAIAINIIHKNSNYAIADIKPSNFKIKKNGLVSVIDIDNIEVMENGKVLFSPEVITPEFSPPEFHNGLDFKTTVVSQNWDRYSLAILFYNILCGIHPFQYVKCKEPYEGLTDGEMIGKGLFLFGRCSKYLESAAQQHTNFDRLHNEIRAHFIQCFDNGHINTGLRPSAEDWCKAFSNKRIVVKRSTLTNMILLENIYGEKLKKILDFKHYSTPQMLHNLYDFAIPEIAFQDVSGIISLTGKIMGLFGKSKKQKLVDDIKNLENDIKSKLGKKKEHESNLASIISEFGNKQQEIIIKEKKQIDLLLQKVKKDLKEAENLSSMAVQEETTELSKLQTHIETLINKEEQLLTEYHNSLFRDLMPYYEQKHLEYKLKSSQLENKKRSEIDRLTNHKDKLINYRIAPECLNIFFSNLPTLVAALARNNFVTAADFTRVSVDGCLLNSIGSWVKITGLGSERSDRLRYWRVAVEEKENNKIRLGVDLQFKKLEEELSAQWGIIETNHKKIIEPLNVRFSNRKSEANRNKDKLYETKDKDAKLVNSKYDKLHNDFKREFIVSLNRFYSDTELVYSATKTSLHFNLSYYETKLKSKAHEIKQISEYIAAKGVLYDDLYLKAKFWSK